MRGVDVKIVMLAPPGYEGRELTCSPNLTSKSINVKLISIIHLRFFDFL